jgi:PD-(D/E)XK nuclease superfamily
MSEVSPVFSIGRPDVLGLRTSLDHLRNLLGTYTAQTTGQALGGFDRTTVLSSLHAVLGRLDTASESELGLTAGGPTPWLSGRVPELAPTFATLQDALAQRLERILGPGKIAAVRRLLAHPVPDLLGLLGKTHDENMNSAILGWLLDPRKTPGIAFPALSRLVSWLPEPEVWRASFQECIANDTLCVRTEYTIAREWTAEQRLDRIDIVVSGPRCVLAIENKIRAREHDAQTESYWAWLEPLHLLRGGLFLSPGGLPALSPGFKEISYLELLSCLLEGPVGSTLAPSDEILLASYVKTLSRGPLQPELRCIR